MAFAPLVSPWWLLFRAKDSGRDLAPVETPDGTQA
jgi:hypothetical protein